MKTRVKNLCAPMCIYNILLYMCNSNVYVLIYSKKIVMFCCEDFILAFLPFYCDRLVQS